MKLSAKIAVIGGSGLYQIEELKNKKELSVRTPFGKTSDKLIFGEISNCPVFFLPRHGRKHNILPSEIPHQANIWALKSVGVETIISVSAVGSLDEKLAPSHFVFPDQFVDETRLRKATFFGNGVVAHVPMAHPFCMEYSKFMFDCAKELGITSHFGGTYVCIEGPAFSTKAESEYHRKMGYSIIGMTVATEAKVAREAGMNYAPVSLVTDYDCWKEGEEVDQSQVVETLHKNIENMRRLLVKVIPEISKIKCNCGYADIMKTSLLTSRNNIPANLKARLRLIIG